MAGVSVALAAEYLGQDANQLAANLPADFIEQNQVILKEKRKKKHRSKDMEHFEDEEDEEERRRRRKKGRKKDGKLLPKVGVKELAARMEGELFQDMQVGTKMVITRDEARDVIRESKKKERKMPRLTKLVRRQAPRAVTRQSLERTRRRGSLFGRWCS